MNNSVRFSTILSVVLMLSAKSGQTFGQAVNPEDINFPGLDIEIAAGLGGYVDQATPVCVSLLMNNFSQQPIEGELVIRDRWMGKEKMLEEVFLTTGSSRRFSAVLALNQWQDCNVAILVNGEPIWQRSLPLQTGQTFSYKKHVALIVNNSTRVLQLPAVEMETPFVLQAQSQGYVNGIGWQNEVVGVASEAGLAVESGNVKPWQLPDHPAPLRPFASLVFTESIAVDDFNNGQWLAIAKYLCEGGTAFVHQNSQELIDKLLATSPLPALPAEQLGKFSVRQIGLGKVLTYAEQILLDKTNTTEQAIVNAIATLPTGHLCQMPTQRYQYQQENGHAEMNRLLVIVYFLAYALLSGVVTLLFFRRNRRFIGTYTAGVIGGACVVAGLLGASMRISLGDAHVVSVTQLGPTGAIQFANIQVQSAGNRNSRLATLGTNSDVQVLNESRWFRWSGLGVDDFPAFTKQQDQQKANESNYQVNIDLSPWGKRTCHAERFDSDLEPLEVGFSEDQKLVKVRNTLPFELQDIRVIFEMIPENPNANETQIVWAEIGKLTSGEAAEGRINNEMSRDYESRQIPLRGRYLKLPRHLIAGRQTAWIVANIPEEFGISLDEDNSDFTQIGNDHYVVQRIEFAASRE